MATPTPTSVAPRVAVTRCEVLAVTVARIAPGLIPCSSSPPPNLTAEPQVWISNIDLTGLDSALTSMKLSSSSLLTRAGRLGFLWRFSNMKEEREGGLSKSCIEDWDLGILGGRTEYLLHTDLVLHTLNVFLCRNSFMRIIFNFSLSLSLELM